jgi:hypothetical protein
VTTSGGEPVRCRGGQTELQIAAPSKPKPAATQTAAATPAAAAQPANPGKPLSRLEKLRLEGKQAGAPK